MHVRLEVSHKSGKKKTVNIRSDALIGRSAECSLRIASSEISRKHCKLTIVESGVLVRDLESANGTWIDGKIIPPSQDVALPPGSRLSVGPVQFVVHYEAPAGGIEPPGSTVNLPAAAGAVAAMTPMMDVDAEEETAEIPDAPLAAAASPTDGEQTDREDIDSEDIDSEETIATTNAALQTDRISPAAEPDAELDAEVDLLDVEEVDEAEDDVPETEEPAEVAEAAEAAEVAEDEPAAAKGKRGSVFGGLLRFGRKPKEKPSEVEPADAADPAAPVEAETPAIGPPAEADAAEEEYDGSEEEYADEEYDDGEYEDEEYEEDAGEEAAEEDSQLGDFFRQFDK